MADEAEERALKAARAKEKVHRLPSKRAQGTDMLVLADPAQEVPGKEGESCNNVEYSRRFYTTVRCSWIS
jgi:hypothetical protein